MNKTTATLQLNRSKKIDIRNIYVFSFMLIVLIVLLMANILIGSIGISISDVFDAIIYPNLRNTDVKAGALWKIRLPRVVAVLFLGGALALSGFLLQTFFANPIAGPYVLGISSGAKMMVAIAMIVAASNGTGLFPSAMILSAFAGSIISMVLVLAISRKLNSTAMLIVGGVMIGYICSAITDFVVTFADDSSIVNLRSWSLGSFSGMTWDNDRIIVISVTAASVLAFMMSKQIGAYQLGEGYAKSVGLNVIAFRTLLVIISSFLSAVVTAFAGPISFVGVAVPHIVRSLLKSSKPIIVIPGCFLVGANFCLLCDLVARTVASPIELSISSVTAIFGAPIVIMVMVRRRKLG